ncbi:ATP-binding protein [Pedobacter fastidiosus]|uniref:histidine kinase n=1 Tax=Pedobacter fastidiosus TaxID=2765361 RepID=A0ABR7KN18_9SPHI|nr:GAF domain-containing sensor histidine kinase [Pedobacter fastidiosus]MBC6109473.1 GAF domain-containing sensor histidine kinase [Pedobacter fastidiosus]
MLNFNLPKNIAPANEEARLKKLREYEILDTPAENGFNHIAMLAKGIFEADNAYVTFIDEDRVFLKANAKNQESAEIKRNDSFCTLAILTKNITVFEDTNAISGFLQNPYVKSGEVRFYASAPIITPEGYIIGTVSVTDKSPRKPTEDQLNMLSLLSKIALDKLETRLAIRKSLRAHDDRLHMLVHDLKNPMTTISLQSELAGRISGADEKVALIAGKINQQSKNMIDNLNFILSAARREKETFKMQKIKVDLNAVINQVINDLTKISTNKNQQIIFIAEGVIEIYGDQNKLNQIFNNLIENAIKFSEVGKEIKISLTSEGNLVTVSIQDFGQGLSKDDLERLFLKFANLSSNPTANEDSNGLGLSTVKMFVDMHKGKIWAESVGQNLGTTFYLELPIK